MKNQIENSDNRACGGEPEIFQIFFNILSGAGWGGILQANTSIDPNSLRHDFVNIYIHIRSGFPISIVSQSEYI